MNWLKILTISSVSIWLGAIAFFSVFVTPAAFSVLGREAAGSFVSAVFPRYYLFGAAFGLLALAGVLGRLLLPGGRGAQAPWGSLVLVLLMLAVTFYVMLVLLPDMEPVRRAMRAAGALPEDPATRAFARLHRISVLLNGVTLLAGVACVCLEAVLSRR